MTRIYKKIEKQLNIAQEMRDRITNFSINSLITSAAKAQLTSINTYLSYSYDSIFEERSKNWNIFIKARKFDFNLYIYYSDDELLAGADEEQQEVLAAINSVIEFLSRELHQVDMLADIPEKEIASKIQPKSIIETNKIFIVHGHDHEPRSDIALLLEKQGLKAVILSEQANKNKTIIEKFEEHSDVGFAIVLMTGDDEGKSKKEANLHIRARQNVYFELGFFIGKLGRERVCALRDIDVHVPSDLSGILIEEIDLKGAWRTNLLKEFRAAGYSIDLNLL